MQSIPRAMLWELWRYGRWYILAGVLGANLLPVLLFSALRLDGALDPREPSLIVMQMILLEMNVFIFAAAMFSAQANLPRLYAMPIATPSLVTWRLLPMVAAVGLESAASSAALNVVFGLEWPIWGPALFGAAAVAALAATFWLTEDSGWMFVAFMVGPGALSLWLKGRYGETFSQPTHLWQEPTLPEVLTMLAVGVCAYYVAVAGVSRRRCGERLRSLGIIAWLERLVDPAPYSGLPFRSAAQAQAWYEWRKKGFAMPGAVVFVLVIGLALWLVVSRNGTDLLHGLLVGGGLLLVAALLGGILTGNCGPDDANYEMGSFLATRPITTIDMARTILKTALKSVLMAWLIWAAAFLAVYLIVWATQNHRPALPRELGWWYFPATLIGALAILGLLTCAGLG
ncbi:MAG: hypothetical protein ACREHD_19800, partial [Pirellulales bacterium]